MSGRSRPPDRASAAAAAMRGFTWAGGSTTWPGTREGAIAVAQGLYDDGVYLAHLRSLVAVPTESQMPDRLPDLHHYCAKVLPGVMEGMGFDIHLLENPGRGPVMLDPHRRPVAADRAGLWPWRRGARPGRKMDRRARPWAVAGRRPLVRPWHRGQQGPAPHRHRGAARRHRRYAAASASTPRSSSRPAEVGSPGLRADAARPRPAGGGCLHRSRWSTPDHLHARDQARRARRRRLRPGGAAARYAHHSGHWGGVLADRASSSPMRWRASLRRRAASGEGLAARQGARQRLAGDPRHRLRGHPGPARGRR